MLVIPVERLLSRTNGCHPGPSAGIGGNDKTDPAKTYEANTAAKNKFFDIVEPMGVALAQQVRGDMHE